MAQAFTIWRDSEGIPHIKAPDLPSLYKGQGRISEFLDSSDASLGVDRFFRRMN